jgi:hypothetical protein
MGLTSNFGRFLCGAQAGLYKVFKTTWKGRVPHFLDALGASFTHSTLLRLGLGNSDSERKNSR